MAKNKWLIPSLIIAGFFFMGLSWFMSTRLENQSSGLKLLARIVYNSGEVYVFHKNMTTKETLKKSASLYYLDTVETGPNGDATFEMEGGHRLRVLDNTLITMDQEGEKAILILKRGDVQVEALGAGNNVMVSKNGQRMTLSEYESQLRRENAQAGFPEMAPVAMETPTTPTTDSLSSEYIQDTLKRQIPAFDKCYKQLLQRTPGTVGQVVMTFTIERSGKIVSADATTSTINNADFKRCLSEAIRRVEFKSFRGDPITSTFPLSFE